jgi:hypothetical protein
VRGGGAGEPDRLRRVDEDQVGCLQIGGAAALLDARPSPHHQVDLPQLLIGGTGIASVPEALALGRDQLDELERPEVARHDVGPEFPAVAPPLSTGGSPLAASVSWKVSMSVNTDPTVAPAGDRLVL